MHKRRVIFFLLYLIIVVYGVVVVNAPYYFLFVPLIPFLLYFTNIFKIKIPIIYEIILLIFIIFSILIGSMLNFYEKIPFWDIILHTSAGMILSFIPMYFIVLYKIEIPIYLKIIFVFLISMGFASLWEMFEFGVDNLLSIDSQKNETQGVTDTMIDICVHSIGTIIFLITYLYDQRFLKCKISEYTKRHMTNYDEKNNTV